jgi:hypothetical protein
MLGPIRSAFCQGHSDDEPAGEGRGMTPGEKAAATDRLRRALLAFQAAQSLLLAAHRRLKGLPAEEVEAFWSAPGGRIERHVQAAAAEVVAAFKAFSAAGLVASGVDRHLVTEAQRHLAEGRG